MQATPLQVTTDSPVWLSQFIKTYQNLGVDNLSELNSVYASDVIFIDPIHQIAGFDNLRIYFEQLYSNLSDCSFVIDEVMVDGEQAAIYWTMQYCHPKLNKGKPVCVQGHSLLKGLDDKVVYHRDYLDLGAMLYEHIPVVGGLVKWLKVRASK